MPVDRTCDCLPGSSLGHSILSLVKKEEIVRVVKESESAEACDITLPYGSVITSVFKLRGQLIE